MFQDRLDLTKCFFIGHSFGGATGILSLASEPRFKYEYFASEYFYI